MHRRLASAALLLCLAGLACGADPAVGARGGPDGGSGNDGSPLAYHVTDLGGAVVYSIDPQGRVAGNALLPSGQYGGGIYSHGSGWSAVPVPQGATLAEAVGIDKKRQHWHQRFVSTALLQVQRPTFFRGGSSETSCCRNARRRA